MNTWVDDELTVSRFGDTRLNKRLEVMLASLGERSGSSLPTAFQDWANTKVAYRFFANKKVSEDKIMDGHFRATGLRTHTIGHLD